MLSNAPMISRLAARIRRFRYAPAIQPVPCGPLARLGTKYGGWTFEPSPDLFGSTIISAGLGEDASFDVEFANAFNARVIVVDPTPRAVAHYHRIAERMGQAATAGYVAGGSQPVEAYELAGRPSLELRPFALWTQATTLRFYSPVNRQHVSHSVINFQNGYSTDTPYIEVPALPPEDIAPCPPLMKLDIEGAEIEVIAHMMQVGYKPRQLLVEFDEMTIASARSKQRAEATAELLQISGYECRYFDGLSCYLFALPSKAQRQGAA